VPAVTNLLLAYDFVREDYDNLMEVGQFEGKPNYMTKVCCDTDAVNRGIPIMLVLICMAGTVLLKCIPAVVLGSLFYLQWVITRSLPL